MISPERLAALQAHIDNQGHSASTAARMRAAGIKPNGNGPAVTITVNELREFMGAYHETRTGNNEAFSASITS